VSLGNDGDFSDKAMTLKVNSALANSLGNLCQRVLTLIYKNCDQAVPKVGPYSEADEALLSTTRSLRGKCDKAMSDQTIQKYVDTLILMIVDANKYIDEMTPWVLRKTNTARMATVLYVLMEVLRFTAILYQPVSTHQTSDGRVGGIFFMVHVPEQIVLCYRFSFVLVQNSFQEFDI
jgi:methionyl-tRNA synthetase